MCYARMKAAETAADPRGRAQPHQSRRRSRGGWRKPAIASRPRRRRRTAVAEMYRVPDRSRAAELNMPRMSGVELARLIRDDRVNGATSRCMLIIGRSEPEGAVARLRSRRRRRDPQAVPLRGADRAASPASIERARSVKRLRQRQCDARRSRRRARDPDRRAARPSSREVRGYSRRDKFADLRADVARAPAPSPDWR